MKKQSRLTKMYYGLFVLLFSIGAMFVLLIADYNQTTKIEEDNAQYSYHIQVIVENTDEKFWNAFKEGALKAGEENNTYVEFVQVNAQKSENVIDALEKGINAQVDGIAFQPVEADTTKEIIEKAADEGTAIVTYENGSYVFNNVPTIGSNSYNIGNTAGNMAAEASERAGRVAVIVNNSDAGGDVQYKNMIVQGIIEAFSIYGAIDIEDVYTVNSKMYETEKLTAEILKGDKCPDVIICIDELSTPVVAQVIVDKNQVGNIKLVGYGTMPQTVEYIRKGVIFGTVCPDSYDIGYYSVLQLIRTLNGEQISDAYNTELYIIDQNNIGEYIETTEEE